MDSDKKQILVDAEEVGELFTAALAADYTTVRRLGNRIAKKLSEAGDEIGARKLRGFLRKRGVPLQASGYIEALPMDSASRLPLIEELAWPTSTSLMNLKTKNSVDRFLEDAENIKLLEKEGVSSRLGLMLYGPPGTGKSLLAGHIASKLSRPIYMARLDSLISSRLGETSKNIRGIFDFIPTRNAVLFLDEMDAVAKLRDDKNELGELKRVVNTVLQGLDSLSDEVLVVGATNHPHLLDPAIWRRFPYKIEMGLPDGKTREIMWQHFLEHKNLKIDYDNKIFSQLSEGLSGAEIEQVALAVKRRSVLDGKVASMSAIILGINELKAGRTPTLDRGEISPEEKKQVIYLLTEKTDVSAAEIGRILGISRQMVHKYLKARENG